MKVCIECGLEKPLSEFRKRKTKKGFSYSGKCWKCQGKNKRKKQEAKAKAEGRECKKITRAPRIIPKGFKYCWKCKEVKPIVGFKERKINPSHLDGRESECIECRNAMDKMYQFKLKHNDKYLRDYHGNIFFKSYWWMYDGGYCCLKYIKPIECIVCGVVFKPDNSKQLICSKECRRTIGAERQREYHKRKPWMLRARKYRRKLRETMQDDGTCTAEAFKSLYQSRDTCVYCERELTKNNTVLDHIEPLSLNGMHSIYNLVPCCKQCNEEKAAKPFIVWVDSFPVKDRERIVKICGEKTRMEQAC